MGIKPLIKGISMESFDGFLLKPQIKGDYQLASVCLPTAVKLNAFINKSVVIDDIQLR